MSPPAVQGAGEPGGGLTSASHCPDGEEGGERLRKGAGPVRSREKRGEETVKTSNSPRL